MICIIAPQILEIWSHLRMHKPFKIKPRDIYHYKIVIWPRSFLSVTSNLKSSSTRRNKDIDIHRTNMAAALY